MPADKADANNDPTDCFIIMGVHVINYDLLVFNIALDKHGRRVLTINNKAPHTATRIEGSLL